MLQFLINLFKNSKKKQQQKELNKQALINFYDSIDEELIQAISRM